jgi:hypothetical protein
VLGLVFALTFNIGAIASITSAIFTIIYIFVLISHYRLASSVGGNKKLLILNTVVLGVVFSALLYYQWQTELNAFYGTLFSLVGALVIEYLYRYFKKRRFKR